MPWVVGIDEAGYGPNLGPLVQAAVAVTLPDGDPAGWETLKDRVYRRGELARGRLLVDDSKKVNVGPNGFARLERGLAVLNRGPTGPFGEWLRSVGLPGCADDLAGEAWHAADWPLPAASDCLPLGSVVAVKLVTAPVFNAVVEGSGSKATVLTAGLLDLLAAIRAAAPADESVAVVCDQLGGRTHYAPFLQAAFPDGWVVAECESADACRYRILNLGPEVTVTFRPRADADSVSVALASMLAKYLREVCMRQFNAFWAEHVPGIKPTAGYPVDSKRFYAEIRPAMDRLGIPPEAVWRCR
jgi:hypothetical protein